MITICSIQPHLCTLALSPRCTANRYFFSSSVRDFAEFRSFAIRFMTSPRARPKTFEGFPIQTFVCGPATPSFVSTRSLWRRTFTNEFNNIKKKTITPVYRDNPDIGRRLFRFVSLKLRAETVRLSESHPCVNRLTLTFTFYFLFYNTVLNFKKRSGQTGCLKVSLPSTLPL